MAAPKWQMSETEMWAEIEKKGKEWLLPLVLAYVNKIRTILAYGEGTLKELPKGITGDSDQCVLARALSNGWRAEVNNLDLALHHKGEIQFDVAKAVTAAKRVGLQITVEVYDDADPKQIYVSITNPPVVYEFINAFDHGEFPNLVLNDEVMMGSV